MDTLYQLPDWVLAWLEENRAVELWRVKGTAASADITAYALYGIVILIQTFRKRGTAEFSDFEIYTPVSFSCELAPYLQDMNDYVARLKERKEEEFS